MGGDTVRRPCVPAWGCRCVQMAALAVPKLFQPTAGAESCMCRGCVHLGACEFLCGTLHTCWGCLRPCSVPTPASWC